MIERHPSNSMPSILPDQTSASEIIRNGVAVVTGASAGLGRALAVALTARGIRVAGFGRRPAALEETAQACSAGRFVPKVVDVSDAEAVRRAFAELRRDVGDITLLINNAAVYPRLDFLQEGPESFMKSVEINLGGMVACTHEALATMTQTGIGRILEVGSFADLAPLPCSAAYSVSKGAGRIFTRALIADISDRFPDIVVSTWMPGILATDMGMPDGLAPSVAAEWGASLALWHDRSLTSSLFERDQEILPGRSLKGRVKNLLLFRPRSKPRRISPHLQQK